MLAGDLWSFGFFKGIRSDSKNEKSEVKECQRCRKMISYRASVCPYCGRRPGKDRQAEWRLFKNSFGTKVMVVYLLIIAACAALAALFSG